jgi:sugar/nucleoside kinase (ribokinase family)
VKGVFVGLATLDLIQYVEAFPAPDEKIQALDRWIGVGGPAANAAIAFAALGGEAMLVTALGDSAPAEIARRDLEARDVTVHDLAIVGELAVSSIAIDATGRRTVVSYNGAGFPQLAHDAPLPPDACVLLADGHYADAALPLLDRARSARVPTLLDAGSHKPQMPNLLMRADYVIASAAFAHGRPPATVADELLRGPTRLAAISNGGRPIVGRTTAGPFALEVPSVDPIDTLGAGDVLHGAFAFHLCVEGQRRALVALERAVRVASDSCTRRGPRLA